MNWLISTALNFRVLIVALAIVLVVVGVRSADEIPLDVFPEFAPPLVEIQTEVPGMDTEEVESLVTVPIENSLNGIPYVKTIRSKSVQGLSSVRLIFNEGTNLITARQLVQERLALSAARLPAIANAPVILPPLSSLSRAMKIGMSSSTQSQMDMTELARWTIRPKLMAVPGVANVAIWGEKNKQYQILVNPEVLRDHNLTLNQITKAVQEATQVGAGGVIDTPNQRLGVRYTNRITSPEDLKKTVVAFRNGAALQLGQVADVKIDHPPPIGDSIIDGGLGLMLIVEKDPWANTLDVTRGVEKSMADLQPALGDIKVDTTIFRPATFIERALENLTRSLLIGCVLVIVVLVFFLYDWRAALISSTAIPLSLLTASLILSWRGATINTMVLAGLVIALGEVVDDAIIDVENILRRLRLNRELPNPRSTYRVVLEASMEVRSAVVYATVIVVLAFLPVFFLEGLAGSFFRPLAAAYVLAILASLFVALTVTPALSLMLFSSKKDQRHSAPFVTGLRYLYRKILPGLMRIPALVLLGTLALCVVVGMGIPMLGQELLPRFKETDFLMHWVEKPGIGIDAMNRITIRASDELLQVDGVLNFGSHIGRAEVADEVVGPNFTELWISIDENVDYDKTVAEVQEVVDGYPGLYRDLLTYLTERIKEVLTGTSATIVVRIYGPNLDELRTTAERVAGEIKGVDGVTTLKVEPQVLVPHIALRMRPEALVQFGLTPGQVMQSSTILIKGLKVGEVYEDQKIYEVMVWGTESCRTNLTALRELLIDTPTGGQVPLGDLAEIDVRPTPNVINRENTSRRIDVSCNVDGRDLGAVAREIEERVLGNVNFEAGYHPEFLGEYKEAQESQQRMFYLSLLSISGILVLLYVDFQSLRLVIMIFVTLLIALLGGIIGAFVSGGVISLGSLVGFVTVLGIAARNSIMLISHYRHLQSEEGMEFGPTLILQGAEERLAPILMTACTTGLALLPLVIAGNLPGHEIEYPMAFVILGGLLTSTLVNLLVLPVLYSRFGNVKLPEKEDS